MLSRENSTTEAANKDAPQTTTPSTTTTNTATTTIPSILKDKLTSSEERFKYGVIIRGKFIGVEDVKEDHGDEICKTSMIKLKALVLAKKEHKQRICVKVSLDGVEILDERTNTPIFNHPVTKISYIARDPDDSRAIGYIFKNNSNSFQYFAIKTIGQAQELFNTLKELFEVVLEMRTRAKKLKAEADAAAAASGDKKEGESSSAAKPPSSPTEEQSKDQEMIGLANTIQKMNEQPPPPPAAAEASLFDVNSDPNNLVSSFEDTLKLATPAANQQQQQQAAGQTDSAKTPSDDLFSLMDPVTNAPSPQDNQLSMLKAQISNIQTFAIPPPRMAPAVPSPGVNPMMANPFGGMAAASPMTPPTPSANPFGNMGVAMGVPLTQFAPPGGAPGFISPNPNVFSSQIPNPQAAVNPNPSTSQLPW